MDIYDAFENNFNEVALIYLILFILFTLSNLILLRMHVKKNNSYGGKLFINREKIRKTVFMSFFWPVLLTKSIIILIFSMLMALERYSIAFINGKANEDTFENEN